MELVIQYKELNIMLPDSKHSSAAA